MMSFDQISLGAPRWLVGAVLLAIAAAGLLVWSYGQARSRGTVRALTGLLKWTGIVALATCLVEPLFTGTRPKPGSNLFLVVADNSRSLQLSDADSSQSRGRQMQEKLS